ncbi:class I SAM-dependent methyltransferase [Saprospiraceae bacterium]|nr:class I SAM-dependent methyltransferase [Saprospiraceae bacterium]MDG1435152.1 methyltransferase domain-containing protein [Saprospiraceae bacterium]
MSLRWKIAQAAEIRWWQNYLKKRPKADYLIWKRKYWKTLLSRLNLTILRGEKVLDAGCGPAGIFMVLEEFQTDAMDPLLDDYEKKLDHFSKSQYPNVRFFNEPLETFSPNERYKKVFCLNAINHVADLDLCFDKLVDFTEDGGTMIVSIDAHNFTFFKKIFRVLPGDILHPHQFNLEEYQRMIIDRGCKLEQSILYREDFFFNYYILIFTK